MERIIECVPNFSEGRNREIIGEIVGAIEKSGGVKVLDVDPGEATNRTVVTFVGSPEAVLEAAFQGVRKAGELINMRHHHGAHPRSGATDVLPIVPVSGITLEECAELARSLAERIFRELEIPCYCYESAAFKPERKNLAVCRSGEYEALPEKMTDPDRAPDFGPGEFTERAAQCGATNVGARDFLIAVNYNLNTTSTRRANAIAFDVREKGRPKREGNPVTGAIVKDADGNTIMIPGTLKGCKAIGWYIDEYGIAQVSMNITDINTTPLHRAFDDLEKQHRSTGISEDEIIRIAVKSMGLDDLRPFSPQEKVIEYVMESEEERAERERLVRMTCKAFAYETASESPAPGGGSISAYMGALGAALGTMVANLSSHKPGWDDRWKEFSDWASKGQDILSRLLALTDEDTAAFNMIMSALGMPKGTDEEKAAHAEALEKATLYATEIPLKTMLTVSETFPLLEAMAAEGNPNSVSDAGVGALAARSAVLGAYLNVKINAAGLADRSKAESLCAQAREIADSAISREAGILDTVHSRI